MLFGRTHRGVLFANYTPPRRGFVIEPRDGDMDEETGELTLRGRIREKMIQKLAAEWNAVNAKLEEESFRSEEYRESAGEALAEAANDYAYGKFTDWMEIEGLEDEYYRLGLARLRSDNWPAKFRDKYEEFVEDYVKQRKLDAQAHLEGLSVIEDLLSELGARMMRPYEHWNEDEKYMEYAERSRYDDDY